jgi:hypothetical protein
LKIREEIRKSSAPPVSATTVANLPPKNMLTLLPKDVQKIFKTFVIEDFIHVLGEGEEGGHVSINLSFKQHIDILCSKLSKSMYCPNRVKNFVDKPSVLNLYYSMIHSNISYGINIYGCANTTNLEKIRKKQKQAIRIISNAPSELIQPHCSKN